MLDLLAEGGGFALRWLWQASLLAAVAIAGAAWFRRRRPLLAQGLLFAAFGRFLLPPISLATWVERLPALLVGPRQQGLELLVSSEAGIRALSWPAWLLAVYLVGVVLAAVRLAWQQRRLSRLVAGSRRLDAAWVAQVEVMGRRLGLRRIPEIRISDRAALPFVASPLRPIVVLPRRLADQLRPRDLERIVAHELAHLRRGDLWWNAILAVAGVIWFFHPLFHQACAMWRRLAEEQSDALVVDSLEVSRPGFSRALVAASAACVEGRSSKLALAFLPGRRHHLELRLLLLAQPGPRAVRPLQLLASALVALTIVAALGVGAEAGTSSSKRIVFAHDPAGVDLARDLGPDTALVGAHRHRH